MATILIVEDDPINRQLFAEILRRNGHQILEAADGAAAVDMACAQPLDLILMDVVMPVMRGDEATRAIRSRLGPAAPPIVALTAMEASIEESPTGAFDGCIPKPVQVGELLETVQRVLDR